MDMRHLVNLVEGLDLRTFEQWDKEIDAWSPPRKLMHPRPIDIDMIRKAREVIRYGEGGGGMCHFVSEWIENKYGWTRCSGSYLSMDGEVICGGGHLWNELPDGTILDATADQFGEGFDVRLVPPDDPQHGRYDMEWFEDFHPHHADYVAPTRPTRRSPKQFAGELDFEAQDRIEAERGRHWADTDPDNRRDYDHQQKVYGDDYKRRTGERSIYQRGMSGEFS